MERIKYMKDNEDTGEANENSPDNEDNSDSNLDDIIDGLSPKELILLSQKIKEKQKQDKMGGDIDMSDEGMKGMEMKDNNV